MPHISLLHSSHLTSQRPALFLLFSALSHHPPARHRARSTPHVRRTPDQARTSTPSRRARAWPPTGSISPGGVEVNFGVGNATESLELGPLWVVHGGAYSVVTVVYPWTWPRTAQSDQVVFFFLTGPGHSQDLLAMRVLLWGISQTLKSDRR